MTTLLPILFWLAINLPFALLVGITLRIHNRKLASTKDDVAKMKNTLRYPIAFSLGAWFVLPLVLIPILTARAAGIRGAVLGIAVVAVAYALGYFLRIPLGGIIL